MLQFQPQRKKVHPDVLWQNRAVREGRGTGFGPSYRPFIQIRRHDFASRGLSQLLRNPMLGREHHFLSVLEYQIGLRLLHLGAIDLREQFPLRLSEDDQEFTQGTEFPAGTISLAKRLGIRHPEINWETSRILTTDMIVTDVQGQNYAIFVRYVKDMPAPGTRQGELLDLQRQYWLARSVPFFTLDERSVDPALTGLLIWAHDGLFHSSAFPSIRFLEFLRQFQGDEPLTWILAQWVEGYDAALAKFKTAIFTGRVTARVSHRIFPTLTQPWDFQVTKPAQRAAALANFLGATHG